MPNSNTFLVSDETVNRYGYRILSNGIDTKQFKKNPLMYYLHERFKYNETKPRVLVIGKWENLVVKDGKLYADAVFDEKDDFAMEVKGKVERGYLKMASISVDPLEHSSAPKFLQSGQTRATVTKSELIEISIVDRGGNNNALKLTNSFGELKSVDETLPLLKLNINENHENMSFKTIAVALKLNADATETEILEEVEKLKKSKLELADFTDKLKSIEKEAAIKLVDKAITKGIIPESLKEIQLSAFAADFKTNKEKFEELLDKKPASEKEPEGNNQLADFITKLPNQSKDLSDKNPVKDFAWYEKNDPKSLENLQAENPKEFNKLLETHLK